jgi:hypothetical protein
LADLYGPLKGQPDVEKAVLSTYAIWLNEYLAEVERQKSLPNKTLGRPPTPESLHGGLDFASWLEEELPALIVIANPLGQVEYAASAGYTQTYEVQVGAILKGEGDVLAVQPEDEARILAGYWGEAVQLLVQHGDLGEVAERTRMVGAPKVEYCDSNSPGAEQRRFMQSVTTFHVTLSQLIVEEAGPFGPTPKESPGYEGEPEIPFKEAPEVKTTTETITAKKTSEPV